MKQKFNILLVDDNTTNVDCWAGYLQKENRKIFKAFSGYEALRIVLKEDIHLVITDIDMPVEKGPQMDGFILIKQIKERRPDVFVIFAIDDHETLDDVVHGLEDGAVDYLKEPLHPELTDAKVAVFEKLYWKREALIHEQKKSDELLHNILPASTIEELKKTGKSTARHYKKATVLFTDFVNFTMYSEKNPAQHIVEKLNRFFSIFDGIIEKWSLEKIKTIGDAYMAAGGVPIRNKINPILVTLAAIEINDYMLVQQDLDPDTWEIRIGIHTGPVISGIVGKKKYQYDIWGDTVNTASRVEGQAIPGKINISKNTYEEIKKYFDCEYRGKLEAKHKGLIDMYNIIGIKKEYADSENPNLPNEALLKIIQEN